MDSHGDSGDREAVALLGDEPRTKATTLTDRLVTAIAVGEYSPGERLPPERELAASLGVSRQTVRQALQQVTELGLIETRRGRSGGAFVAQVSWEDIAPDVARRTLETEIPRLLDLYDYRCMVEGMIARAAAERRTDEDVAALEAALGEFEAATSMTQARNADRRLHGLITAAGAQPAPHLAQRPPHRRGHPRFRGRALHAGLLRRGARAAHRARRARRARRRGRGQPLRPAPLHPDARNDEGGPAPRPGRVTQEALTRVSAGQGLFGTRWQVKDSNLRSSRDGFTVRFHWPLGQPAVVRLEG